MTAVRQDRLRAAMAGLALLGIAIAGYLTWVHYAGLKPVCLSGGGGCEKVQSCLLYTSPSPRDRS